MKTLIVIFLFFSVVGWSKSQKLILEREIPAEMLNKKKELKFFFVQEALKEIDVLRTKLKADDVEKGLEGFKILDQSHLMNKEALMVKAQLSFDPDLLQETRKIPLHFSVKISSLKEGKKRIETAMAELVKASWVQWLKDSRGVEIISADSSDKYEFTIEFDLNYGSSGKVGIRGGAIMRKASKVIKAQDYLLEKSVRELESKQALSQFLFNRLVQDFQSINFELENSLKTALYLKNIKSFQEIEKFEELLKRQIEQEAVLKSYTGSEAQFEIAFTGNESELRAHWKRLDKEVLLGRQLKLILGPGITFELKDPELVPK